MVLFSLMAVRYAVWDLVEREWSTWLPVLVYWWVRLFYQAFIYGAEEYDYPVWTAFGSE